MAPTESARSALSSFTCTLCNKSYSRHPEYESHISSYDHQHRKRLQDLKQLSRDPNAAEKARRAERKADADAGLRVIDTKETSAPSATGPAAGGGFKKGGFKSSFATVKGPVAPIAPAKKNVLGDDEEDDQSEVTEKKNAQPRHAKKTDVEIYVESDTDEDYPDNSPSRGYYDPRKPTGCFADCPGAKSVMAIST
ncbi:C2H2 finger domain protein [Aspergillus sclerotialis]|uniref:C2H2 finger domain protein n=1 Tax=Aspergillus sclerotialis TaxID=2070753 RepID=A0A3A3A341_9EURO|nr:C2H2 finger domain protein [Aspergillus sclerotialis]